MMIFGGFLVGFGAFLMIFGDNFMFLCHFSATFPLFLTCTLATLDAAVDAARARNDAETLFASNVMYTFFRLYYFLYSRLGMVKQLGEQLKDNPHGARRLNTAARNLGLQHKLRTLMRFL